MEYRQGYASGLQRTGVAIKEVSFSAFIFNYLSCIRLTSRKYHSLVQSIHTSHLVLCTKLTLTSTGDSSSFSAFVELE